jgi:hypothetical protein
MGGHGGPASAGLLLASSSMSWNSADNVISAPALSARSEPGAPGCSIPPSPSRHSADAVPAHCRVGGGLSCSASAEHPARLGPRPGAPPARGGRVRGRAGRRARAVPEVWAGAALVPSRCCASGGPALPPARSAELKGTPHGASRGFGLASSGGYGGIRTLSNRFFGPHRRRSESSPDPDGSYECREDASRNGFTCLDSRIGSRKSRF